MKTLLELLQLLRHEIKIETNHLGVCKYSGMCKAIAVMHYIMNKISEDEMYLLIEFIQSEIDITYDEHFPWMFERFNGSLRLGWLYNQIQTLKQKENEKV